MRVLVDSSSLYSALLHDGRVAELLDELLAAHHVVVTDYVLEEVRRNLDEALDPAHDVDAYLAPFVKAVHVLEADEYRPNLPRVPAHVSDKDAPVVAAALHPDVDVLLTSDRELVGLDLPGTEVASPAGWGVEG